MIIVQLKGGLGNQLFQYAAALSLARRHNVQLKVDVAELKAPDEQIGTVRHYELQNLINPPVVATDFDISRITNQPIFKTYYQKLLSSYKRSIYNEKRFEFDENFFKSRKEVYLKGYRQSEKYFLPYAHVIRAAFKLNPHLIKNVEDFGIHLTEIESVSIHIRRGDYTNSTLLNYHGALTAAYYQKAIDYICSTLRNPSFFVFSDNIEWVKKELNLTGRVQYISGNISTTHYEDFYLMTCCRHNIIANSSFSWWAAWLNNNDNKIIIAPSNWFDKANLNTKDLIPPTWNKL